MKIPIERTSMCWGVTGALGAGKTLSAVYCMVNVLRDNWPNAHVTTNIALNLPRLAAWLRVSEEELENHVTFVTWDSDPYSFQAGSPRGTRGDLFRSIIVLDECAEVFDQFSSAKDAKISRFLSWLRHSSKLGQDVFLIVQSQNFLNKSLRLLVARWVLAANAEYVRLPFLRIRVPFCKGKSYLRFVDRFGNEFGEGVHFLDQAFWGAFYDTAQILSTHGVPLAQARTVRERSDNLPQVVMFFMLVILIVTVWIGG